MINSYSPGQIGRHFGRRKFQMHFSNENDGIAIRISLKYVPRSTMDNKPTWHRKDDKPLPEPMLTHFTEAYMRN